MSRSRASAKQAGAKFNRTIADGLAAALDNDNIDRAIQHGAKDIGDVANVRHPQGGRIAIECKDYGGRLLPAQWIKEAQTEATNYGAVAGVVVAKRLGTTKFEDQWVLMTMAELITLLKDRD
jgi:hypothetical protein